MNTTSLDFDSVLHQVLSEISAETGVKIRHIEREAAEALEAYSWPGNTEEMRKVLEYAALNDRWGVIRCLHLPRNLLIEAKRTQDRVMNLKKIFKNSAIFPCFF